MGWNSGKSMKIEIRKGLAYLSVSLICQKREIFIDNVLLDTGSAGTIFSADKMLDAGLKIEPHDKIRRIRGVGGTEFVITKQIDRLYLDGLQVTDFNIEIGAMDYGVEMNGILGLDFLLQAKAHIDLEELEIL
jgi:hypothetical protein